MIFRKNINKNNLKTKTILGVTSMAILSNFVFSNIGLATNKVIKEITQDEVFVYHGSLKLVDSNLNNAEIRGSSTLMSNNFNGPVEVEGNSDLKENNFNNKVELRGSVKSNSNKFHQDAIIRGTLKDKESNFYGSLTMIGKATFEDSTIDGTMNIDSNEIKLIDTKAHSIDFINTNDERQTVLYLKNNAVVDGNINFSNNKGKVYADKHAKINGSVTGGELLQKK